MANKKITDLTAAAAASLTDLFESSQGGPDSVKESLAQIKTLFDTIYQAALPTGMIILWHGTIATIPSGWVLCDGSGGTPDLRNKFVICANADSGGTAKTTIEGAASQSGGSTAYKIDLSGGTNIADVDPAGNYEFTTNVGKAANTNDIVVVPPFFALAYIMKQ